MKTSEKVIVHGFIVRPCDDCKKEKEVWCYESKIKNKEGKKETGKLCRECFLERFEKEGRASFLKKQKV